SNTNTTGGLVGLMFGGTLSQAYATGAVKGTRYVGGLVGDNTYGTISQTYATGSVTGANRGGLVGLLSGGTVQSS
ncbi:GLUG motif-containing protein, partial [Serratia marcescens]|uniref:GLUG motif-containing protein n=1 Tax=Serratia marcescens TaxID=615 RepID=UPI0013DB66E0